MFEGTQELAESKLLLLYIFNNIKHPLSNSTITEIVLENNLMNYFHLQQYLGELVNIGFLSCNKEEKRQVYTIAAKGQNALEYFENRIKNSKKESIQAYINSYEKLEEDPVQGTAKYDQVDINQYNIICMLKDKDTDLIEIKLCVKSADHAKLICSKWESNAMQIYSKITNTLIE